MAESTAIMMKVFLTASREGEFTIPCKEKSTATHLRFRLYSFARGQKKAGVTDPAAKELSDICESVMLTIKGNNLVAVRKDKEEAMLAALEALGDRMEDEFTPKSVMESFERVLKKAESGEGVELIKPDESGYVKNPYYDRTKHE